ncbi:SNF2 family DNA-dependent ATPase [Mycena pura]|uniref:SNF2 family DNA-dependent ATPase n=1 Tax=Mycena pura TaxID=153505 RepID=A0AAD6VNL7_9AGAR|nr:SNF2 family DNA-dependent ATPase [Mycena pura]
MENLRRRLAEDPSLYPGMNPRDTSPPISILSNSTASSGSVAVVRSGQRHPVVISSDEDELDPSPVKPILRVSNQTNENTMQLPNMGHSQQSKFPFTKPNSFQPPPIRMPVPEPYIFPQQEDDGDENILVPDFAPDPYGGDVLSPEQAESALRDLMASDSNADDTAEVNMEEAIVPGLRDKIRLMPHQVLGRAWMRDREDPAKKRFGGILADDMGLGKTIQTLVRIVDNRPKKRDRDDGWDAPTLVVCPLALVGQWADEIKTMVDGFTVVKHQGPNRGKDAQKLRRAHVVITTYDTVRSEHAGFAPTAKDDLKNAAAKAKADTGSDSEGSDSEAEHFGRTVAKKKGKAPVKSKTKTTAHPLFEVKWFRIVLDEAHNIKNRTTKNAVACCELQGKFRWCLTGTPMQNKVDELFSLLKFLRIKPLNEWERFNTQIAKPVKSGKGATRAMKRLQVVLKQVMLRRTKTQQINGKVLVELPSRTINVISCDFNASEQAFYTALETKMESVVDKLMKQSAAGGGSAYIGVLVLLLRLRQACNHPCLVSKDYKTDIDAVDPKPKNPSSLGSSEAADVDGDDLAAAFGALNVTTRKCQVCMLEMDSRNMAAGEAYCLDCEPLALQAKMEDEDRNSSAKIRMVLKLLREIDERSDGEEKTIIFSQFTSMLNLMEPFLREAGVRYVRYDGSMKPQDREAALTKIKNSANVKVILISFKAGSTGLNLTACNNVILVDLWWNPALEDQAFDRSHRVGQKRPVNIFKLKIDNTVEDRILALQDQKRELAMAALSGDKIKNMKLGMEDLMALFRPGGRDEEDD